MKSRLGTFKPFAFLAVTFLSALVVAGCSSGPDIKPPPTQSLSQAGAPGAQAANLQTSLAAMDRQLVELWQAQMETQRLINDLATSCGGGGNSGMPQTMGETSQVVQQKLRDQLQQQQQALQTLSQIMKQMHDAAEAIVRKMG